MSEKLALGHRLAAPVRKGMYTKTRSIGLCWIVVWNLFKEIFRYPILAYLK